MKVKVPKHSGNPVTQEQADLMIAKARGYIGTRWQHMGRNPQGLDCAGLIIQIIYDVLRAWIEVSDYSPWPNPQLMRKICSQALLRADRSDLKSGSIILTYVPGAGVVHMGIFTGKTMIHACNDPGIGRVVESDISAEQLYGIYWVPQYEV